jgi:hypothetical protein
MEGNTMNIRLRTIILVLILGISIILAGCSDTTAPQQDNVKSTDYQLLKNSDKFYGAHIGFGGTTPSTVHAYRDLLDHPKADASFKKLIESATMPGRLYGLAGVYFTDPSSLPDLSQRFLESSESVPAFFGCILSDVEVKELAQRIVDGSLPRELLDEW